MPSVGISDEQEEPFRHRQRGHQLRCQGFREQLQRGATSDSGQIPALRLHHRGRDAAKEPQECSARLEIAVKSFWAITSDAMLAYVRIL